MSNTTSTSRAAASPNEAPSSKRLKTNTDDNVIDLTGPDPPRVARMVNIDDNDDDEVEIVDPPPKVTPVKSDRCAQSDADVGDDDVQVTGTTATSLPHMRPHCTKYPLDIGMTPSNSQACELCYCYVCDAPFRECEDWASHCQATDRGPRSYYWKSLRQSKQASGIVFEATIVHGKLLKNIFQTMGKFEAGVVCVECDKVRGMSCSIKSSDAKSFTSFQLLPIAFETFNCNERTFLQVPLVGLNRQLRKVTRQTYSVELRTTKKVLTITVIDRNTGEQVSDPEQIPLYEVNHSTPSDLPTRVHKCDARISAGEFKKIMGHMSMVTETCIITPLSRGPNSISFSIPANPRAAEGLVSRARYTLLQGSTTVSMNQSELPFRVGFNMRLLNLLTRPPPLSRYVNLSLSPYHPMEIEYPLEDHAGGTSLGRFTFILAPSHMYYAMA